MYGVYESTSEFLSSSIGLYYMHVQPRSNTAGKANADSQLQAMVYYGTNLTLQIASKSRQYITYVKVNVVHKMQDA